MKVMVKPLAKIAFLLVAGLSISWVSYWAGFSKSLRINLYINQRNDLARSMEYGWLAKKIASGDVDEVEDHLKEMSGLLKEQSVVKEGGGSGFL